MEIVKEPCNNPLCSCQYNSEKKGFQCFAPHLAIDRLESEISALQRKNDNQGITIAEFQKGLGEFINAPIGKVAFFSEAEKYLINLKSEVQSLSKENNRLNSELIKFLNAESENKLLREEIERLKAKPKIYDGLNSSSQSYIDVSENI